jgi:hypothetical protein
MPMIAPKTQSSAISANVAGSKRLGCRCGPVPDGSLI